MMSSRGLAAVGAALLVAMGAFTPPRKHNAAAPIAIASAVSVFARMCFPLSGWWARRLQEQPACRHAASVFSSPHEPPVPISENSLPTMVNALVARVGESAQPTPVRPGTTDRGATRLAHGAVA